ncbi:MAG: hypothetical protein R2831_08080 [Chitinophagaceae bacterium]
MDILVQSAKHNLHQLKDFLNLLSTDEFIKPLPILSDSTIGMHTRHIIEFYQCIVNGMLQGNINYDERERNTLTETNLNFAIQSIENCLQDFNLFQEDKKINLHLNLFKNQKTAIQTTIKRELLYVIEHSIHHMAILKMACKENFLHIGFPNDFGVAFSTINFRNSVHSNVSASS